jgi:hypothetical protein
MNANKRKKDAEITRQPTAQPDRYVDRIYNGSYEEYEDAADYIDMLRGWPTVLKGRVIA